MFLLHTSINRAFYPYLSYSECIWGAESNRTIYICSTKKNHNRNKKPILPAPYGPTYVLTSPC